MITYGESFVTGRCGVKNNSIVNITVVHNYFYGGDIKRTKLINVPGSKSVPGLLYGLQGKN